MALQESQVRQDTAASVPFALPEIDETDIEAVVGVLQSRWLTTGPKVREFESTFAELLGVRHAVAVNSATAALHLALDAIGLRPGDEVIIPTMTFTACGEVVRYFDAIPVLVDVEPDTMCVDVDSVRAAITPRTRAIMPVHLAGQAANMDGITDLARENGLAVIEDCAHAFPAGHRGRPLGTLGDLGTFSFYATKTVTTGEGGMLITNDDQYAERARVMSLHGMSRDAWKRYTATGSWRYDVVAPGFKYNMTDMAAALGISQLAKMERMWHRRAEIAGRYSAVFGQRPELETPTCRVPQEHAWHLYILRLNLPHLSIDRDAFMQELRARGIGTSVHFIPLHTFSYYREAYGAERVFPVADREFQRTLSLPIYSAMTDDDVDHVIAAVMDVVLAHSRSV